MQTRDFLLSLKAAVLLAALLMPAGHGAAAVIFVDNRHGSDAFDGTAPEPIDGNSGPVKTIRRGLQLADTADTIVLANRGIPYYESIQLVGRRHSGTEHVKFTIAGNGAVISGLRTVPPKAWRQVGTDLWTITPWRKGHYQLLDEGKVVPEHRVPRDAKSLPKIPEGHWGAWRGSIYYQAAFLDEPAAHSFQFAYHDVGLTLFQVQNVRIRDVTFRHFRLDGINAHDLCRNVVLDNVKSIENGRAGLAVGGTASVAIGNSELVNNRLNQLRISEFGVVEVEATKMSAPPTIIP